MKQKLFLDFDDTLVQSSKAFCDVYNNCYDDYGGFKPANYKINNDWSFQDICPLLKPGDIHKIFSSKMFFDALNVQPNCIEVLNKWSNFYDYYIVSIGTKKNLQYKIDYIDKYFPMVKNLILLNTEELEMNKNVINMAGENNIFIDDHQDNLYSVNVEIPILFIGNGLKKWNEKWQGLACANWEEVDKLLLKYYMYK